jgi:hypothetical protein
VGVLLGLLMLVPGGIALLLVVMSRLEDSLPLDRPSAGQILRRQVHAFPATDGEALSSRVAIPLTGADAVPGDQGLSPAGL